MKRDMIEIGTSILGGLGIGAVVMYLFDPDRGMTRRRDLSRQAEHMMNTANDAVRRTGDKARHMRDTASSYLHQGTSYLRQGKDRLHQARASMMHDSESCPAMKAGMIGAPILGALLLGASAMFLLDPTSGRRRRARIRDKARHYVHETRDSLSSTGRHLSNKAKGMMHETRSMLGGHESNSGHRLGAVEEHGRATH